MSDAVVACPACGGTEAEPAVELAGLPVMCGVLWDTPAEAVGAARGDIRLVACTECSMLRNAAFDPSLVDYEGSYDNSLHFSPTFQRYADDLAGRLVDRHGLRGRAIVEIGSGKGDFLRQLCRLGGNTGWGYDPAYAGEQGDLDEDVTFVPEYFGGDDLPVTPDLVCARHVLEHLIDPASLLASIAGSSHEGTVLYVEVPDARYVLSHAGLWDVIYPHVGYFTAPALRRLVARSGFQPRDVGTSFGNQYLWVEATAGDRRELPRVSVDGEVADQLAAAEDSGRTHRETIARWDERLDGARRAGERVALWGAGAKGVTFLNAVPAAAHVADVVDLNPRKHGGFVPGTGQEVVGPERLAATRPDLVLVMNPMYEAEIRIALADLGLQPTVTVV
jgi:hypothetical protein